MAQFCCQPLILGLGMPRPVVLCSVMGRAHRSQHTDKLFGIRVDAAAVLLSLSLVLRDIVGGVE